MNIASIKVCDTANGPGIRTSVFVSGCRRHCKDCFNEIAWDFDYGVPFTDDTLNCIIDTIRCPETAGISILGGEPFEPENVSEIYRLVGSIKLLTDRSIWIYSGYTFEELLKRGTEADSNTGERIPVNDTGLILYLADVLVDGPFISELKDITLDFRGSSNQRIIDVRKSLDAGEVVLYKLPARAH